MNSDSRNDQGGERLRWLQRERGICSVPDCDATILGWCADCDARGTFQAPKLCGEHLMEHCEGVGHTPYLPYAVYWQAEGQDA